MKNNRTQRAMLHGAPAVALAVAVAIHGEALAQESAQVVELEEIIVTARRVEEDIQKVPVTVTALSGEQLKEQSIDRPVDLQFAVPSLAVGPGLTRVGGGYTIRGLPAGVVTYFNDVPGGPTQVGMPFYDLASVQVLNGPQGTLFGRTSAAGAVLVSPQRPKLSAFEGLVDLSVGDYGRLQGTGVVNIPIVDGILALRIGYHYDHIDGYTKQLAPTQVIASLPNLTKEGLELDETNSNSARVGLELKIGGLSNYLVYNYLDVDQTAGGFVMTGVNPTLTVPGLPGPFFNLPFPVVQQIRSALLAEDNRIRTGGESAVRFTPALQGAESFDRLRHDSVMDVAEYDFGDLGFTTFVAKNLFSYQENSNSASYGLDGLGGLLLAVANGSVNQVGNRVNINDSEPSKMMTEEFQLRGSVADMVDWQLGYFYQKNEVPADLNGVASMFRSFSGMFANSGYVKATDFQAGSDAQKEEAVYGQVTVDLDKVGVHGLSLTGGYRTTDSDQESRTILATSNASGTLVPDPAAVTVTTTGSSGNNYTFAVNEQITPDVLVYATTSKSYVPGGVNAFTGCNVAPNCKPTYDQANILNYELGVKTQFALGDAQIRLNGGIYRLDFEDIHVTSVYTTPTTSTPYTTNAAEAQMQGLETHMDVLWSNWSLTLNYSYIDAEYTKFEATDPYNQSLPTDQCLPGSVPGTCLLDLSNNPFARTPEHQGNATIRYTLPLNESLGNIWVSLTSYYQSRQYIIASSTRHQEITRARGLGDMNQAIVQDAYSLFNARVSWDDIMDTKLSAGVFVNNLTDETYSQAGGSNLFNLGTSFKLYQAPRMWGVNLSYRFGH